MQLFHLATAALYLIIMDIVVLSLFEVVNANSLHSIFPKLVVANETYLNS